MSALEKNIKLESLVKELEENSIQCFKWLDYYWKLHEDNCETMNPEDCEICGPDYDLYHYDDCKGIAWSRYENYRKKILKESEGREDE